MLAGPRRSLASLLAAYPPDLCLGPYDVTARIGVPLNWFEELKRLVPAS